MGVCKCQGSERWLSNEVYRNQASGFTNNPLGLDTSLCSYSTGADLVLLPVLPQLLGVSFQQLTVDAQIVVQFMLRGVITQDSFPGRLTQHPTLVGIGQGGQDFVN